MAIYSLNMKSVKVGSGKNAIAKAAYISADTIKSERTGLTSDYHNKENVIHSELTFPKNVPQLSREELWNAVEKDITVQGQNYGKSGHIALPAEWSEDECILHAREFLFENFAKEGHAVDWAVHMKQGNPHIDYFVTQKRIGEDGKFITPKQKKVYANDRDKNGKAIFNPDKPAYDPKRKEETSAFRIPIIDPETGLQKVRVRKGKGEEKLWERVTLEDDSLNSKEFLLNLRKAWQDFANAFLDEEHQIDCRTLEAQGIDREPEIHVGATAMAIEKKHPGFSERVKRNHDIKENNLLKTLKKEVENIQIKMQSIYDKTLKEVQKILQGTKEEVKAWKPPQPMQEELLWLKMHKKKKKPTAIKEKSDDWSR